MQFWQKELPATENRDLSVIDPYIDPQHEKRINRVLLRACLFCVLATTIPCVLSLLPFKPPSEPFSLWFQRSGAVMTAFAVFAQVAASNLYNEIQGSDFAESWAAFHKYENAQRAISITSTVLVIVGTLIWGYGDILIGLFQHLHRGGT
jgi:hypothetical protein